MSTTSLTPATPAPMNHCLEFAHKAAQEATEWVRAAHREANHNHDEFASLYLLHLIGECAVVSNKIRAALCAANLAAKEGKL